MYNRALGMRRTVNSKDVRIALVSKILMFYCYAHNTTLASCFKEIKKARLNNSSIEQLHSFKEICLICFQRIKNAQKKFEELWRTNLCTIWCTSSPCHELAQRDCSDVQSFSGLPTDILPFRL